VLNRILILTLLLIVRPEPMKKMLIPDGCKQWAGFGED
jgi:hypothetical protein